MIIAISVHHEEDEETGQERWTISDIGGDFDDEVVDKVEDVAMEVEQREFHYANRPSRDIGGDETIVVNT